MTHRKKLPTALAKRVLASGNCAYCGHWLPEEVDHILPVAQGGTDDESNLAPACCYCNREKTALTPEQWQAAREAQGLCWPPPSAADVLKLIIDTAGVPMLLGFARAMQTRDRSAFELLDDLFRRARRGELDHPLHEAHRLAAPFGSQGAA